MQPRAFMHQLSSISLAPLGNLSQPPHGGLGRWTGRNNALAVALMAAASALSIQTTQDKGLRLEFTAEDPGVFIKP